MKLVDYLRKCPFHNTGLLGVHYKSTSPQEALVLHVAKGVFEANEAPQCLWRQPFKLPTLGACTPAHGRGGYMHLH